MRHTFAALAAALVTVGIFASDAHAQTAYRQPQNADVQLVDSWYRHYLGRPVDDVGLQAWLPELAIGHPEAGILGSPEYYNRHGGSPQGFVAGLYVDVLGRQPSANEVQNWVFRLNQMGWDRVSLADEFLGAAGTELNLRGAPQLGSGYTPAAQVVVTQQPVVSYYTPVYDYGPSWYGAGYRSGYWGGNRNWGGGRLWGGSRFYGGDRGGRGYDHHHYEGRHGHR
jgi:hypothetical protein